MDKKQLTVRKSLPSQNNRSSKKSQKSSKCILIRERTFENVKSTRIWWNCIFAGTSYLLTDAVNKVNVYTTSFSSRKQSLLVNSSTLKLLTPLTKQTMNSLDIFKRQASILIKPIQSYSRYQFRSELMMAKLLEWILFIGKLHTRTETFLW